MNYSRIIPVERTILRPLAVSFVLFGILLSCHAFPTAQSTNGHRIDFTQISVADMKGPSLNGGAIYTYRAGDGVVVRRTVLVYRSVEMASKEFNDSIKRATKIIEGPATLLREPKVKRSVVLLRRGRSNQSVVLRLSGTTLEKMESQSLQHALALEKQIPITNH